MKLRLSFLFKYNARQKYDILSALRGPDDDADYELKELVTARIRSIVFAKTKDESVFGIYNDTPLAGTELDALTPNKRSSGDVYPPHFVSHLWEAVNATVDHPVWGGLGRRLLRRLIGH